jgi:hypothetical protein
MEVDRDRLDESRGLDMAPWAVQHQLCVSRPRPGQCPDATTRLRMVPDVGMLRSVNFYSQEQIDNELAQIRIADWTYAPVAVEDWPVDAPMQPPLIPVTTTHRAEIAKKLDVTSKQSVGSILCPLSPGMSQTNVTST